MTMLRGGFAKHCAVGLALAFVLGIASDAPAKTTNSGAIAQIKVIAKHHKSYSQFHGVVWLDVDKSKNNYRWGGKQCRDNDLTDEQVGLLFHAFRGKYNVSLDYEVMIHDRKTYRCITGFTLSRS